MDQDAKHYRWSHEQALAALELRKEGLSYSAIAVVLRRYHECPAMTPEMVRVRLRYRGVAPKYHGRQSNWGPAIPA